MSGKHRRIIPRRRRRSAVTATVTGATLAAGGLLAGTASAATAPTGPLSDYVVASGDTLAQIAAAHAAPGGWQQIYDINRDSIANPDVIVIGQHLKLPAGNAAALPAKVAVPAGTPAAMPAAFTAARAVAARAVTTALAQQGTPYVYGGSAPGGFDCSGLIQWTYEQVGITLPRTAAAQSTVGHPVSLSQLQPGDLLFFYQPVEHVVMYVGDGKIAEASQPGTPVHVRPMYLSGFAGARRIV
ncbi:MAG: NlpC/P60 family protein [Pseudonocardiaceae bacterium]